MFVAQSAAAAAVAAGLTIVGINNNGSASAFTVPIPAHQVGDLIIIIGFRSNSTQLTKPAAGGTVPTWIDIDRPAGANSRATGAYYAVATANNHTSGTNNASSTFAIVIRGQGATPIGGHSIAMLATSTNCTAGAVTLSQTDGTSLLLAAHAPLLGTLSGAPSGYTRQNANANSGAISCINTKDVTTSDGAVSQVVSPTEPSGNLLIEIRQH